MFILLCQDENQGTITEMMVGQKSNFILAGHNLSHISQSEIIFEVAIFTGP